MKKIIYGILLVCSTLYCQEKGRISLIFNNEKIDLPFRSITISKYDKITVKAQAEFNNDSLHQVVGLELGFNKLSPEDKIGTIVDGTGINIITSKSSGGSTLDFYFWSKDEVATYSVARKRERVTYQINSFGFRLGIDSIDYLNNELIIKGHLSGEFRSIEDGNVIKQVAEIKDCIFEIIL